MARRLALPGWLPSSLARRAAIFLVGTVLVLAAAIVVIDVVPSQLGPEPGERTQVTEKIDYWTPEAGDQQAIRTRSMQILDGTEHIGLEERLAPVHSPRGSAFSFDIGDGYELLDEPGARMSFPPTPLFGDVQETVHLGVPWSTEQGDEIGAFDTYHWMGSEEREGLDLARYQARHAGQFFVADGTIWYRSVASTALVEPVSGTVVDYRHHETLWAHPQAETVADGLVRDLTQPRERVWTATVEPTPTGQTLLVEEAQAARSEHLEDLLTGGLPILGLGEVLLWIAIVGRPPRILRS